MSILLSDIYDEYPEEGELLAEVVNWDDFHRMKFHTTTIDPVNWFAERIDHNGETLREIFEEHAQPWQRKLVQKYRRMPLEKLGYLVVENDMLIDGHHRLVALALNNVRSYDKVIDLSSPAE